MLIFGAINDVHGLCCVITDKAVTMLILSWYFLILYFLTHNAPLNNARVKVDIVLRSFPSQIAGVIVWRDTSSRGETIALAS